jgi:hypothetical protein
MDKVECPCCGAKLKITVEPFSALSDLGAPSRPAKSQYATVRDTPPMRPAPKPLVIPKVEPKKYRTNTDIGAFRQALADAGFVEQAENGIFFNDKNVDSRRLKLWFGTAVVDAEEWQGQALRAALLKYFGDRLIMCGSYATAWDQRRGRKSYIVRLEL